MDALIGFGSPWVVVPWLIASLLTIAWFVRLQRQRSLATIPSYVVLVWFFIPILLQYPFTFSPLNVAATGADGFQHYVPVLDRALLIYLVGMASFAAGFSIKARQQTFAPVRHVLLGLRAWSSGALLWITSAGVIALFAILTLAGLTSSEGMRNAAMTSPALRPFFNLVSTVLPMLIGLALLVAIERRRVGLGLSLVVLMLLAMLTGSRGAAFGGIAAYIATVLTYRSLRYELSTALVLALIPAGILFLLFLVFLGDLRVGQYDFLVTIANFGKRLFYGNNFSDFRDFSWILSYWNGEKFFGRTQLAGVLGFVPSVLFPLRKQWGWGARSLDITGLVPYGEVSAHPGLRPGVFGEWYFNFGLLGVIFAGFVLGYVVRRIHTTTVAAARERSPFEAKLAIYAAYVTIDLVFQFLVTSAFFRLYATLLVLATVRVGKYILRVIVSTGDDKRPTELASVLPADG